MTTPRPAARLPHAAALFPPRVVFCCQLLLVAVFLTLAPVLVVRRLTLGGVGAENPLLSAVLTVALGLVLRRLISPALAQALGCEACPPSRLRLILAIVVGVLTGALVTALGRWGEQLPASLLGLVIFAVAETVIWLFPTRVDVAPWRTAPAPELARDEISAGPTAREPSAAPRAENFSEEAAEEPELTLPAGVQQQITRAHTAEGETALVLSRLTWSAGQRQQVLHVAFCPPLAAAPRLHLETVAGPEVDLRATLCEPFGLRLEAKRSGGELAAGESLVAVHALASGAAAEPAGSPHE